MKVSTKGRYGLRIMVELAVRHGAGPVLVTAIARSQDVPAKYIHVLIGGLKAAGLVTAVRGPNGGLELAREPGRITPLDVLEALEGPLAEAEPARSGQPGDFVIRAVWTDLAAAMAEALGRQTLADLAARVREHKSSGDAYVI